MDGSAEVNLITGGESMGVKFREKPVGSGIWWIFIDHQGKRKAKEVGEFTHA
jgi:hypothetical protein